MTSRSHNQCNTKIRIPQLRDLRVIIKPLAIDFPVYWTNRLLYTFLFQPTRCSSSRYFWKTIAFAAMGIKDRVFWGLSGLSGARLRERFQKKKHYSNDSDDVMFPALVLSSFFVSHAYIIQRWYNKARVWRAVNWEGDDYGIVRE